MDKADNTQESHRSKYTSKSMVYEIRVQGQLDSNWSDWFNGLEVTPQENGETLISGSVMDQAALQGILMKVFDLRLTIISVRRIQPES